MTTTPDSLSSHQREVALRFTDDTVFARARDLLRAQGFDEDAVEAQGTFDDTLLGHYADDLIPDDIDAAGLLIGLFLRAGKAQRERLLTVLGAEGVADLEALGLLQPASDGYLQSPMRIRPMYGMYVVSDHWDAARLSRKSNDDVVMAPDFASTLEFLSFVPHDPCRSFLEACGGAGAAALVAAQRFAAKAYSFDLTERSTVCAAFSARLSGIGDFEARCGDTYEPAAGLQFDRIVAHPPYMPMSRQNWIFYTGGSDGEQITRRHVEDLPKVLAPGGRFYCRALGTDRREQPCEARIRSWLGAAADEYDLVLVTLGHDQPLEVILRSVCSGHVSMEDVPLWQQQVQEAGIERFVPFLLVLQRHDRQRPAFTVRRAMAKGMGLPAIEWLVAWETLRADGQAEALVLSRPLLAAPPAGLLRREIRDGQWQMSAQSLRVEEPFVTEWNADDLSCALLLRCNGERTGQDLLQTLINDGLLPPNADAQAFAARLVDLVSAGFVQLTEPPA